jgi:spoIIIJ-associated protein
MTENAAGVAVQDETDPPSGQGVPGQEVSGQEVSGDAQNTGDQGTGSHSGDAAAAGSSSMSKHDLLVAEGDAAGDYLERLLDILDFDGDIDLDVEGERAVVSIIGDGDVDRLVGDHGEVLDALQELTRLAAMAETGQRSRLMLDIAGYRAKRRAELTELGRNTAEQVADSGEPVRLAPMNPFERKVVHDAVGTVAGVESSSEGEEPRRRVVVSPAS